MQHPLVDGSLEEPAPDFLTHLELRLGISRDLALKLLCGWLSSYEPVTSRAIAHHVSAGPD